MDKKMKFNENLDYWFEDFYHSQSTARKAAVFDFVWFLLWAANMLLIVTIKEEPSDWDWVHFGQYFFRLGASIVLIMATSETVPIPTAKILTAVWTVASVLYLILTSYVTLHYHFRYDGKYVYLMLDWGANLFHFMILYVVFRYIDQLVHNKEVGVRGEGEETTTSQSQSCCPCTRSDAQTASLPMSNPVEQTK